MKLAKIHKVIFSALIFTLCSQTSTAKELLAAKQFRDIVAAKIESIHPKACIEVEDDWTLSIGANKTTCGDLILSIDNSYEMYRQQQDDLDRFVNNLVSTATDALNSLSSSHHKHKKEQLSIVLRNKSYLDYLNQEEKSPNRSVWKPFFGDLIALMVINESKSVGSASFKDISDMQLDEKSAWKTASNNLRNNVGKLDKEYLEGLTLVYAQSGFATGLLWLPEACIKENEPFFAMVISRHSYVYANANATIAQTTLLNFAGNLVAAKESLSENILLCEQGNWQALSLKGNAWIPID